MTKMIELVNKDIEIDITVLHNLKKLEKKNLFFLSLYILSLLYLPPEIWKM